MFSRIWLGFTLASLICSAVIVRADEPAANSCERIIEGHIDRMPPAAQAFSKYFRALNKVLVERGEVITLIETALLAREHILLMGPPGNAKSLIVDKALGGISEAASGERSYYRIQMTPETTMSETHGPISPKEVFDSGRIVRHYDQGMLFSRNVFIDEIFDARSNAQRNILGMLAERQHAQGTEIVPGKIETVIAATNRYLDEVYEKAGDQGPKALLDRFSFNVYIPGEFEHADSYDHVISSAGQDEEKLPTLTFDDLDELRALTKKVVIPPSIRQFLSLLSYRIKSETEATEQSALKIYRKKLQNGDNPPPPYRATKFHSPRTLFKSAKILRAIVVLDWINSGGKRNLTANIDDLKTLKSFFVLTGPNEGFARELLNRTPNPYERSQLSAITEESKIFDDSFNEIARDMNEIIYQYALDDLDSEVSGAIADGNKEQALEKLIPLFVEAQTKLSDTRQAHQSGKKIGYTAVAEFLKGKIQELAGEAMVQSKIKEIEDEIARQKAEETERQRKTAEENNRKAQEQAKIQEAQERQRRIDVYIANRISNLLSDPVKNLDVIGEFSTPLRPQLAQGDSYYKSPFVHVGEETLVFTPTFGMRIRGETVEPIDYSKLSDVALRSMLMADGLKSLTDVGDGNIALKVSNMLAVINAQTLSLVDLKMLNFPGPFAFSKDGKYGFALNFQANVVDRFDLTTGEMRSFSVGNISGWASHFTTGDVLMASDANNLFFTANNCQYLNRIVLDSGGVSQIQVNNFNTKSLAVSPQNSKFAEVSPHGHNYQVVQYEFTGGGVHQTDIGAIADTYSGGGSAVAFSDTISSPDGRFIASIFSSNNPSSGINSKFALFDLESKKMSWIGGFGNSSLAQVRSLVFLDNEHLMFIGDTKDKTIYRIYRIKPLSREELETVARGLNP